MTKFISLASAFCVAFVAVVGSAGEPAPFDDAFVKRAKQSVVHLGLEVYSYGDGGARQKTHHSQDQGTGYIIGSSGASLLVITCLHCVDEFIIVNHRHRKSKEKRAAAIRMHHCPFGSNDYLWAYDVDCLDEQKDLALLSFSVGPQPKGFSMLPALKFETLAKAPSTDDKLLAVGFPGGKLTAFQSTLLKEETHRFRLLNTRGVTLASAPKESGGISGSPVLSENGTVVATWWGRRGNQGLCQSLKTIHQFLDANDYGHLYRSRYYTKKE